MDEASKYLLGQGVLGFMCLVLGWALWKLWKENKSLTDRLEAKADKHAELNREAAKQMTSAFEAAIRTAEKQAAERAALAQQPAPRRRPTVARPVDGDE